MHATITRVGVRPCEDRVGVSALVHHRFLLPVGVPGQGWCVRPRTPYFCVCRNWLQCSMSIAPHMADVHEPYWSMQALLDMSLYAMDSFGALQYGSWTVPAVAAVSSMKRKSAPCSGVCGGELYC